MRLPVDPKLPGESVDLLRLLRNIAEQVNGVTEGHIYAHHAALTAAPTTGTYNRGDRVLKSDPVEAGVAGSKYVVWAYLCTVSGTPGTWVELRALTGN